MSQTYKERRKGNNGVLKHEDWIKMSPNKTRNNRKKMANLLKNTK